MKLKYTEGPFRLMGTTTIYPLYDKPVESQGTIYRLDTHTARHPKEDLLGATKCLYIKARHFSGIERVIQSTKPVQRNLWQQIKFQWWIYTKFIPWVCEAPAYRIRRGRNNTW